MIRNTPKGPIIVSKKTGKKLEGPFKSRDAAVKRLGQIEYFKHAKAGK